MWLPLIVLTLSATALLATWGAIAYPFVSASEWPKPGDHEWVLIGSQIVLVVLGIACIGTYFLYPLPVLLVTAVLDIGTVPMAARVHYSYLLKLKPKEPKPETKKSDYDPFNLL